MTTRLRRLRVAAEMTQLELATEADTYQAAISHYERGLPIPEEVGERIITALRARLGPELVAPSLEVLELSEEC